MERYRLTPLHQTRQLDERTRQSELAGAVHDAAAQDAALAAAERALVAASQAVAQARAEQPTTAYGYVLRERLIARRLRRLVDAQLAVACARHAVRDAAEGVDRVQTQLARARADREAIERHFARWRADHQRLADRRADD